MGKGETLPLGVHCREEAFGQDGKWEMGGAMVKGMELGSRSCFVLLPLPPKIDYLLMSNTVLGGTGDSEIHPCPKGI